MHHRSAGSKGRSRRPMPKIARAAEQPSAKPSGLGVQDEAGPSRLLLSECHDGRGSPRARVSTDSPWRALHTSSVIWQRPNPSGFPFRTTLHTTHPICSCRESPSDYPTFRTVTLTTMMSRIQSEIEDSEGGTQSSCTSGLRHKCAKLHRPGFRNSKQLGFQRFSPISITILESHGFGADTAPCCQRVDTRSIKIWARNARTRQPMRESRRGVRQEASQ